MKYKTGDVILHWTHGIGTIVAVEEKTIAGETQLYYAIEVENFKYWVPATESDNSTLHYPITSSQFEPLLDILRTKGEGLPDNQYKRKNELHERLLKRNLEELCRIIRDLNEYSRSHTLNLDDTYIIKHAKELLLDEWVLSREIQRSEALEELNILLQVDSVLVDG